MVRCRVVIQLYFLVTGHSIQNEEFLKATLYSNGLILPLREGARVTISLRDPPINISEAVYLDKFKHWTTESVGQRKTTRGRLHTRVRV